LFVLIDSLFDQDVPEQKQIFIEILKQFTLKLTLTMGTVAGKRIPFLTDVSALCMRSCDEWSSCPLTSSIRVSSASSLEESKEGSPCANTSNNEPFTWDEVEYLLGLPRES
jgi:hypothetical protein